MMDNRDKIIEMLQSEDTLPFSMLESIYNSELRMYMKREDLDRMRGYYDELRERLEIVKKLRESLGEWHDQGM